MSNESVVTQWRKGITSCYWYRYIGTEQHHVLLQIMGCDWRMCCGEAEVAGLMPYSEAEYPHHAPTVGEAKSAATEAGYALLKRLESEQVSMELDTEPV